MSRGPGRRQRAILDAVDGHGWLYLVELLPDGYTRAEYVALHRAACRLADTGRIEFLRYRYGSKKVAVGPPGADDPDRRQDLEKLPPAPPGPAWMKSWAAALLPVSVDPGDNCPARQHIDADEPEELLPL